MSHIGFTVFLDTNTATLKTDTTVRIISVLRGIARQIEQGRLIFPCKIYDVRGNEIGTINYD